ncbi:TnsD family Tn7-like transposition protein [Paraburkholderia madseniana]|uniref:TnsD family Tn7-like transposition protein n=1 Tax=Paraburkholderia madseniana TaxID=2599607 RepID=UPI0038BA6BC2
MTIMFGSLLAGETLHSNFSRYADEIGLRSLYPIYTRLSGGVGRRVGNLYRPTLSFQKLAKQTEWCWGKSANEILLEHTFFRYDTLFLRDDERERWFWTAMSAGGTKPSRSKVSANNQELPYLKYCDVCLKEAKQSGFPAYFTLMHQLPSVLVCPIHETLLVNFPIDVTGSYNYFPYSLGRLKKTNVSTSMQHLDPACFPAILDVARRSQAALRGDGECMRNFPYSELLEEGALRHRKGSFKAIELKDSMYKYYGKEFCVRAGIANPAVWKDAIAADWHISPFRHIVMQSFLAYRISGAGEFTPRLTLPKETLLNVNCAGALHNDKDQWLEPRRIQSSGAWLLTCSCTRSVLVWYDEKGSVRKTRVRSYGQRYSEEFSRLVNDGLSVCAAGRRLNMSEHCVLIRGRKLQHQKSQTISHQKLVSLRRAWSACVRKQPKVGRLTRAFKDSPGLYLKLSIYDSEWLKAFNLRHEDRGHGARISAKWLLKANASLKSAYASLLALDVPVQITWTRLLELSGLGLSSGCARRPEITTLRKEFCESVADFRNRAFNIWLSRLASNRPKTPAQFAQLTELRHLSSAQKLRLAAWLKEAV